MNLRAGFQQRVASVLLLSMLAACASRQVGAPVVDRTVGGTTTDSNVPGTAPVIDNTPVPAGYYRVKPGDRLYRIALENGQNYRDIARWNNIQNPDQIEVGQVLRVKPPAGDTGTPVPATVASTPSSASSQVNESIIARYDSKDLSPKRYLPTYSRDQGRIDLRTNTMADANANAKSSSGSTPSASSDPSRRNWNGPPGDRYVHENVWVVGGPRGPATAAPWKLDAPVEGEEQRRGSVTSISSTSSKTGGRKNSTPGLFANLEAQKRTSPERDPGFAARRESWSEQRPKGGPFAKWWDGYTRGP